MASHPVLLQSGFFSNQKFAQPTATLQFKRLSKARQQSLNTFGQSSKANQQILRKAVVKTGGFTNVFISPAFNPPKTSLAPRVGIPAVPMSKIAPKSVKMLPGSSSAVSITQPGANKFTLPILFALAAGAFFFLKS